MYKRNAGPVVKQVRSVRVRDVAEALFRRLLFGLGGVVVSSQSLLDEGGQHVVSIAKVLKVKG